MTKRIYFGHNDIRFFYYRYKDSKYYSLSILMVTVIVCIILVFSVIIPQADNYFSVRKEVIALRTKINTMNENINFVNNLDKSLLNSQLSVATQALPSEKDFGGIINAITASAVRSGVSVSDFTFRLGNTSLNTDAEKRGPNVISPVSIDLTITGSKDGGKKFLTEISEKVPLVEVTEVKGNANALIVGVRFFYKALPKISFKEGEPITAVTDSKQALIRKLATWQSNTVNQEVAGPPASSSSAVPLF